MQTFTLSVSLPDNADSGVELRLSLVGADGEVVIALPSRGHEAQPLPQPSDAGDEYELGGYAGI